MGGGIVKDYSRQLNEQYGQPGLKERILSALKGAGKDLDTLTRDDLLTFEEFHLRGRRATRELAGLAGIQEGMRVLDLGGGVGGPARTLAAEFECHVVAVDISKEYLRAATVLTQLVGLSSHVSFVLASGLELPLRDRVFDAVWLQHVSMNIPDKDRLAQETWRVLKPGGRLALYEICQGASPTLDYPQPWADEASLSHLLSPDPLLRMLLATGFQALVWEDVTQALIEWGERTMRPRPPGSPPPLGLDLVIGPDYQVKTSNLLRAMERGSAVVIQGVLARAA